MRLLAGDLAESDEALLGSLRAMRADIADVAARSTSGMRSRQRSRTASDTSASFTSWAGGCCARTRSGSTTWSASCVASNGSSPVAESDRSIGSHQLH